MRGGRERGSVRVCVDVCERERGTGTEEEGGGEEG